MSRASDGDAVIFADVGWVLTHAAVERFYVYLKAVLRPPQQVPNELERG